MTLVLNRDMELARAFQNDRTVLFASVTEIRQEAYAPTEGGSTVSTPQTDYELSVANETTYNAILDVEAGRVIRCVDKRDFFAGLKAD